MLRTTVACAGAAFGGADAVTVLPYTWALGRPDAFARRIARNTHLVLQEESALGRVIDPGHGAWFVETLTEDLAKAAWELFQAIEAKGGMGAALESGFIQAEIAKVADARARDIADGPARADGRLRLPAARRGSPSRSSRIPRPILWSRRHLGGAAPSPPAGRAVRAPARRVGRASGPHGQAAAGVPGLARRSCRAFGALDLDAQFPRRRRHRGRRRDRAAHLRRRRQGLRRQRRGHRLHLLLRPGLCRAGRGHGRRAQGRGREQRCCSPADRRTRRRH